MTGPIDAFLAELGRLPSTGPGATLLPLAYGIQSLPYGCDPRYLKG